MPMKALLSEAMRPPTISPMRTKAGWQIRIVPTAIGAMLGAGCSLLVDTSNLAGTASNVLADAALDAAMEIRTDAGGAADAGAEADAHVDADATPTGCARYPDAAVCDDFDEPGSLSTPVWTNADVDSSIGTLTLTTDASISPPSAASFFVRPNMPLCSYQTLFRRFLGTYRTFSMQASVYMGNPFNSVLLTGHSKTFAGLTYSFIVQILSTAVTVRIQSFGGANPSTDGVLFDVFPDSSPIGRWVPLTITYIASTNTLGLTAGNAHEEKVLPADFVARDPTVSFGPYCTDGNAASMLLDDVVVHATP